MSMNIEEKQQPVAENVALMPDTTTEVPTVRPPTLSVVGAWTKAGVASCVHVVGSNKLDSLLLDCGTCEPSTFSVKAVLVTHGHIDHAGCCINHARAVALNHKSPTYFVPSVILEPLITAWRAYEVMNDSEIPMTIEEVRKDSSGNFLPFFATANILVRPFHTEHRVPSHGYALYTMERGKLLPQYTGASSEEIRRLRQEGIAVTGPSIEHLELVYTGDTMFSGLLRPENAFVFEAPILIVELTYLDGKREKAIDRTHVHLEDILDHADRFRNQQIIFVHLSQKYSSSMALDILRERLPASIIDKCYVNLTSFGVTGEHLTKVSDRRWAMRQRTEAGWGWSHPSQRYQDQQQRRQNPHSHQKQFRSGHGHTQQSAATTNPPPPPTTPPFVAPSPPSSTPSYANIARQGSASASTSKTQAGRGEGGGGRSSGRGRGGGWR